MRCKRIDRADGRCHKTAPILLDNQYIPQGSGFGGRNGTSGKTREQNIVPGGGVLDGTAFRAGRSPVRQSAKPRFSCTKRLWLHGAGPGPRLCRNAQAHPDANTEAYSDAYPDTKAHANSDSHAHSKANADPNTHTKTDADTHADADADTNAALAAEPDDQSEFHQRCEAGHHEFFGKRQLGFVRRGDD